MSAEAVVAVLAGVGGAATAVITVFIAYANARHKNRIEADNAALSQYREAVDLQQRQIERLDAHLRSLTEAFGKLSDEHGDCQVEMAALYGELVRLHDYARRVRDTCRRLGEDPGPPPELPERPERPDRNAAEFQRRTLQQTTQSLQNLSGVIPPPIDPGKQQP